MSKRMRTWPDFFLAGDLKAGSTSLYYYLRDHPELYFPRGRKELRYFSLIDEDRPVSQYADSDDYLKLFADIPKNAVAGDASPEYLRSPFVAQRIQEINSNAKFIFILRNPADRLFSDYQMSIRRSGNIMDFSADIVKNNYGLVKQSFLYFDLYKYYEAFGRDQILCLDFECLISAPEEVLMSVYRFLEVKNYLVPDFKIHNAGGVPKYPKLYMYANQFRKVFKNTMVSSWLGPVWRGFKRRNLDKVDVKPSDKNKILQICGEDTLRVRELTGLELPSWDPQS